MVISRLWKVPHRPFHLAQCGSGTLPQHNFWFVFAAIVLPFTTALLGASSPSPLAVVLLSAISILASLVLR